MTKITTVVDDDGKVWTGGEVDTSPSLGESLVFNMLTGGIPAVGEAFLGSDSSRATVEVNGQQHTGERK